MKYEKNETYFIESFVKKADKNFVKKNKFEYYF